MIGLRLNNYELVSLLGEGGMGMVYLARHSYMGRKAAVKILRPELLHDKPLVARFMEEARATNAIKHPNIIDIIDVGMLPETETPYLMMELLEGESLASRLHNRLLPIEDAIEIACQTASALAAAHACEIIHRDLKPDNLFLVPDKMLPRQVRVKVLDFGIAKLKGDLRARSAQTKSGILMGTPFYMSPEQCRGTSSGVDARSDIYSLGVIVYEMVCGRLPFVSDGVGDLLVQHITEPPQRPSTLNAGVSPDLERVILRALAKSPADRYESMALFERALRECQGRRPPVGVAVASEAATLATAETMTSSPAIPATQTTLSTMLGEVGAEAPKRHGGRLIWVLLPIAAVALVGAITFAMLGSRATSPSARQPPAAQPSPLQLDRPLAPEPVPPVAEPSAPVRDVPPQPAASKPAEAKDPKTKPEAAAAQTARTLPMPRASRAAKASAPPAPVSNSRPRENPPGRPSTDTDDEDWGSRQ